MKSPKIIKIGNIEYIIKGRLIRMATIKEEWDKDNTDPQLVVDYLRNCGQRVDILSFVQRLPESKPKYSYKMEWESVAAIPISNYEYWIEKQIPKQARNRVKKAMKLGVVIKDVNFNEQLVWGISDLYNEVTVKQGRKNKHYGMSIDKVREANSTFLDRAEFIGAFWQDELIGYIKIVYSDRYARTMGILGKVRHRDKSPMNLLMAKAVEKCAEKKVPYLTYARYDYGKFGSDTLKDFKKNNGFENIIIPRYYVPITVLGKIVFAIRLHKGIRYLLPEKVIRNLQRIRKELYSKEQDSHR
jgi:hypothetical protein